MTAVIWHDLECGAYAEDLALWRSLAAERGDPVLDIGAGTGRVSLDLAQARPSRHRARLRLRAARRARTSRRALPLQHGPRGRARLRARAAVRALPDADADGPAARRAARAASRSCGARAATCARRPARDRDRRDARSLRGPGRHSGSASRHLRARRGRVLAASRRRFARPASTSCSSAAARRSPRSGERSSEHNVIELDRLTPQSSRRRRARPGCVPAGRAQIPETARLRRQLGGDVRCLSCGSARCTRS